MVQAMPMNNAAAPTLPGIAVIEQPGAHVQAAPTPSVIPSLAGSAKVPSGAADSSSANSGSSGLRRLLSQFLPLLLRQSFHPCDVIT